MRGRQRRVIAAVLLLGIGGLLVTACGDDDDSAAGDAKPPVYKITATETGEDSFSFVVPSDIEGGVVTFELVSAASNKATHDFQLLRLEEGHTIDEVANTAASEDEPVPTWIEHAAGVGSVAPGQTVRATVELEPDTEYGFFCTESTEPEEEGGEAVSHAAHGMKGTFTTGDDSGAEMPEATATVVASEYTFEMDGFTAGANTVKVTNGGEHLHHVLWLPIAEGKTFEDAKAALTSEQEPEGPPPVDFEKGVFTAVFGHGDSGIVEVDLPAGDYAVICFMPDQGTAGPPHVAKGMIKELVVS